MLDESNQIRETRSALIPDAVLEKRGLPKTCFAKHPHEDQIVVLRRGVMGYFIVPARQGDTVERLNAELGITTPQREAMIAGSMFGFHCPAADPARYNDDGSLKPKEI